MLITVLAATILATPAALQQDFRWSGTLAAGRTIEIAGVNGGIDATPASGNTVEVTAVKRGRRSDPDDVDIRVVEHANGVTICAVYPSRDDRANECLRGGRGRNNTGNNDVEVRFSVRVPAGVNFTGLTVNGDVDARGLRGDVRAVTVNGSIEVETTGQAEATTVNGSIRSRMGRTTWTGETSFTTVNGSVTLEFTGDANFDLNASTVNGDITTDFPITVRGRFGARRLSGTIGSGGRTLNVSTVNGDMTLRRRP